MQKSGYVYIIQSVNSCRYYVGSTPDVDRRLREHNSGKNRSTRNKGPWIIKFKQKYPTLKEARSIEFRIKKLKRRDYVEQIIQDKYIKIKY